jgi:hypothetical protein
MRIKVGSTMGRNAKPIYIHASAWPREKAAPKSVKGGLATAHTSPSQNQADLEEVRAYLRCYQDATVYDVALVCHMGDKTAKRLMKEVKSA